MKKTLALAAAIIGISAAGNASAQLAIASVTSGAQITIAQCGLLSQDVNVTLSPNVNAGYGCSATNNEIAVGACSTAGATRSRSITCQWRVIPNADPLDPTIVYQANGPDCAAAPPNPMPNPVPTTTIAGRVAFVGVSTGGQTQPSPIGANCTLADIGSAFSWPAN